MATWHKAGAATIALVVAMSPVGYQMLKSHEGLGQPGASVQKAYADPHERLAQLGLAIITEEAA